MAAFDAAGNVSGVSATVSALTPAAPTVRKMVLLLNNDVQDSAGGDRDGVGTAVTFTTNAAQRAEGSHAAAFDAATDAVTLPLAHPIADGLNGLPLVDNCNRTESPLSHGGQWTTDVLLADASTMTANGSASLRTATAGDGSAWWNVQTFDPDMAISAVMPDATLPSSGAPFLYVRLTQPGVVNQTDGYRCVPIPNLSDMYIDRLDNGVSTNICGNTAMSAPLVNGQSVACVAVGNRISAYVLRGGIWTEECAVLDSTYAGTGYVALAARATS